METHNRANCTDYRARCADVLVTFIQHWAVEMTNMAFICIKRTCRRIAETCRAMEPRRHWDRFEKHMRENSAGFWDDYRAEFIADPHLRIVYNDEVPFGEVKIYTSNALDFEIDYDNEARNSYHWKYSDSRDDFRVCIPMGNCMKIITISNDRYYLAGRFDHMRLFRDRLVFLGNPSVTAVFRKSWDMDFDKYLDMVYEHRESIESMDITHNLPVEYLTPPRYALKAIMRYTIKSYEYNADMLNLYDLLEYFDMP